jgi:phospholipase/lecithinase/hemolysin
MATKLPSLPKMFTHLLSALLAAYSVQATSTGLSKPASKVVVFGDSFSDTGIWEALIWPDYLGNYLKVPVYSFAKAGATCSNDLTPRIWPDIVHNELPLYNTMKNNGTLGRVDPATTVYTLWIGTNDVGSGCMLTGDQKPGVTVVDTTKCAVNWIKSLYDSGARNFLFQNVGHP